MKTFNRPRLATRRYGKRIISGAAGLKSPGQFVPFSFRLAAPRWVACALVALGLGLAVRALADGVSVGALARPIAGVATGELLIGELNCVACHQTEGTVQARLFSNPAPRVGAQGMRLTPQYLRSFLSDPRREKPGTTMPDLLHGLNGAAKNEAVEALMSFLLTEAGTNAPPAFAGDPYRIAEGRLLFHQIGCVACHAPQESVAALAKPAGAASSIEDRQALEQTSVPLGNLARKTTVGDLAKFLLDPLKVRPGGRMPSMKLTEREAVSIATYLLRAQAPSLANPAEPVHKVAGLSYQYFEGEFDDLPDLDKVKPAAAGIIEQFSLSPRKRNENFGFRYSGYISVPTAGRYGFFTESDDGSQLFVDDKLVVDNAGTHGNTEKRGTVQLTAGEHAIMVSYFNGGGEWSLKVSYRGPGITKQEIPASALFHVGQPMTPLDAESFTVNPDLVARGRELFGSLGCAACHQSGSSDAALKPNRPAKSLASLNASAGSGCLGDASGPGAARYDLNDSQRGALRAALSGAEWSRPLAPAERVTRVMAALDCFACHSRDGAGGPLPGHIEYFSVVGQADLGDEGRIPPHLTKVGGKLRPEWTREVLLNKGAVRPYMATRMPQFGEANVGSLPADFVRADDAGAAASPGTVSDADVGYGRKLVGTSGLSCISCHVYAGHKSLGIPAIDLTLMSQRLRPDWFHRYLLDPPSLRPGTRMPAFWPQGKSSRPDILGGDTDRQINAIWAYISRGADGGLPPGLVQGKMELIATNEAVIYRNFIAGAGSRAIGVGYPEKANLAFDANDLRLALIWQGPFIDAARHRTGRGEGFEPPLGYNVLKLPPGPAFAALTQSDAAWPSAAGKTGGYQMHGYLLDHERRPTFLYSFGAIKIEDYPVAVPGDLDASFRRTITLRSDSTSAGIWFRAWVGASVVAKDPGQYLADGKVKLRFTLPNAGQPVIRQSNGATELLIPIVFAGNESKIVEEISW